MARTCPRLKVPVPLYFFLGRRTAFAASCWMARHRQEWLDVDCGAGAFITLVREDLYVSRLATRLLARTLASLLPRIPVVRDVVVTNMEYLLTA